MTIKVSLSDSLKTKVTDSGKSNISILEKFHQSKIVYKTEYYTNILKSLFFLAKPKSEINYYVRFTNTTESSSYPIGIAVIGANFRIL